MPFTGSGVGCTAAIPSTALFVLHYICCILTHLVQADAEDRGEDVERRKNWEYTIEENEAWEKKLKRKSRRADFEFHGEHGCCVLGEHRS